MRSAAAREWYFACGCGCRFAHADKTTACPRCGEQLQSSEAMEPRWQPKLMRVAEVARALSISASKTYELIEKGMLPHHRIDGSIRVSDEQLREYLEETTKGRKPADWPQKANPRPRPKLKHIRL